MTNHANTPSALPTETTLQDLACPFCALLCDDVSLRMHNGHPQPAELACPAARDGFARALERDTAEPAIHGVRVDWQSALEKAHELLSSARFPLIHGLLGDLVDSKAAWSLAAHFGGVVDHHDGAMLSRNLAVLQDSGGIFTTLGETRNRADLIIRIGEDCESHLPRLRERLFAHGERLHLDRPPRIVDLGEEPLDRLDELRMLWRGQAVAGVDHGATELFERLQQSSYPVFLVGPPAGTRGELALRAAADLVREINESRRAAILLLSTSMGAVTAQQSGAWHNGFGIRTSLARGYPEQDLYRFDGHRLLENGESDLLVWVSSLSPELPPPTAQPQIVFGHPATRLDERSPQVYLPVAIPGVHRPGFMHRADGICMLPLRPLIPTGLPSTADLCSRLVGGHDEGA